MASEAVAAVQDQFRAEIDDGPSEKAMMFSHYGDPAPVWIPSSRPGSCYSIMERPRVTFSAQFPKNPHDSFSFLRKNIVVVIDGTRRKREKGVLLDGVWEFEGHAFFDEAFFLLLPKPEKEELEPPKMLVRGVYSTKTRKGHLKCLPMSA